MQEGLIYNGSQQTGDKRCRRDTCLYARNTGGLEKEGRGGPIDVTTNKQRTKGGGGTTEHETNRSGLPPVVRGGRPTRVGIVVVPQTQTFVLFKHVTHA